MNLGMWIIDYYSRNNNSITKIFDETLNFIYSILKKILISNDTTAVVIEENFDTLYISFAINVTVDIEDSCNIMIKDGFVYIYINFKDNCDFEVKHTKKELSQKDIALLRQSH
jgi:acetyltransferase-like isoleucine patch superfamily enzyme